MCKPLALQCAHVLDEFLTNSFRRGDAFRGHQRQSAYLLEEFLHHML